jgi:cell division transport system permease protein
MRAARAPLLALRQQRPGTFALLIAATCLLMLLAAAMVLALRNAAQQIAGTTADRMLVQVVEPDPAVRDAITDTVMARLDRAPGLLSAYRVPPREALALIAPYISGVSANDLPVPTMIELRTQDRASVTLALKSLPNVQITSAGAELGPLSRLIDALRGVAVGIAVAAAIATGLIAMLSARAALAREEATLNILHALGASDSQLSRLVTGKIARDAAIGAALGWAAAIMVILGVGARIAAIGAGVGAGFGVGSWAILALLPLALVGLATAAAQAALLVTLRRGL